MKLLREVLLQNLRDNGFQKACGKNLDEASTAELQDEWSRYELQRNKQKAV